jgi:hypothetical protein
MNHVDKTTDETTQKHFPLYNRNVLTKEDSAKYGMNM